MSPGALAGELSPLHVRVVDTQGRPIPGASVVWAESKSLITESGARLELQTDARGEAEAKLGQGHSAMFRAKAAGYRQSAVTFVANSDRAERLTLTLERFEARAAYVALPVIGSSAKRQEILDLLAHSTLNAVVIDYKYDGGEIVSAHDLALWMKELKARGIYTIARVVAFKDNHWAKLHPELTIKDSRTGRPWQGEHGALWLDPFLERNWNYVIEHAEDAVRAGFDEIQFDYIRFATGKGMAYRAFAKPVRNMGAGVGDRSGAIAGFLKAARARLSPMGVYLSADTFAYTAFPSWQPIDNNMGHHLVAMAPYLDYLSPMAYPSHYTSGVPVPLARADRRYPPLPESKYPPTAIPYETVLYTVVAANAQLEAVQGHRCLIRPWIQSFKNFSRQAPFTPDHVSAQIRGVKDGGGSGFLLWNPSSRFDLYRDSQGSQRK